MKKLILLFLTLELSLISQVFGAATGEIYETSDYKNKAALTCSKDLKQIADNTKAAAPQDESDLLTAKSGSAATKH